MNEMIERVEVAIMHALTGGTMLDAARAAVEAMREPTDQMLDAGGEAFAHYTDKRESTRLWRAMIDEALK